MQFANRVAIGCPPVTIVRIGQSSPSSFCSTKQLSHRITKQTKWPVRPAKSQISLGIRAVWSFVRSVGSWGLSYFVRPVCPGWAHRSFCLFCHVAAHLSINKTWQFLLYTCIHKINILTRSVFRKSIMEQMRGKILRTNKWERKKIINHVGNKQLNSY